ncbi:MAG TPA: LLM class F420-dependent oxidoreductase, partial [Acidimicrobiales bacterium]|nr:LLM class F420-dependent oxidoreductase [Acidimicrobiales bacterium]
ALEVIPDEVTDALVLHGSVGSCRDQVLAYCEAGVTIPAIAIVPFGVDLREAVRGLAQAR